MSGCAALPIVDCAGRPWGPVRVAHGEMTCTVCGETAIITVSTGNTATGQYCPRCEEHNAAGNLIPTVDYLRAGEWIAG